MKQTVKFRNVIRLAGAYVACAIGSGFATGQEIMQFFTGQGIMSLAGTLVTTVIFAWCGARFMKHGFIHKLTTPESVLAFYAGKKAGKLLSVLIQIFLYSVFVIMISGAGATLSEFFGLPPMAGRIVIAGLALVTVAFGLSKAADILGGLGSVIIVFSLAIGGIGFLGNVGGLRLGAEMIPELGITVTKGGWLWSSVLYPGFNAIVVIFMSCCLGSGANSAKEASVGGALGGILFGLAILVMDLGLTANIGDVFDLSVPTLALAKAIAPSAAVIFSVIIICGIYTTAVPMLWSVVRAFAEDRTKKSVWIASVLTVIGLLLGMTDFKVLVNTVYPFSGYVGVGLLMITAIREIQDKIAAKRAASQGHS